MPYILYKSENLTHDPETGEPLPVSGDSPDDKEYDTPLDELLDMYATHQAAYLYHASEASKALRAILEIYCDKQANPELLLHVAKSVFVY